jgi:hypothetical protein
MGYELNCCFYSRKEKLQMNKIHEKKPNQLVFDYKYSDIGILPTMKELTQDEIYKKYIRRSTTWYKYTQKGVK